jgi:hypothetical protein
VGELVLDLLVAEEFCHARTDGAVVDKTTRVRGPPVVGGWLDADHAVVGGWLDTDHAALPR